jgi:phosphopantetheinyl transferase (holo-ACP synthase)
VEIAVSENGKPFVIVAGRLGGIFRERGIGAAHLSLSHEKEYAVASVVLEKEQ